LHNKTQHFDNSRYVLTAVWADFQKVDGIDDVPDARSHRIGVRRRLPYYSWGHFCRADWRPSHQTKKVERERILADRKKSA
jgi:hypothetical protein